MAELNADGTSINARIVIWGPEGSGKSTNIERIFSKLRPDHRGELRKVPTRLDPTVMFEVLPIELGAIGGLKTTIQILGVPGVLEALPTRKNLLDKVDGVVLVMDSQRDRIEANVASFQELKQSLAAYGRSIEEVPIVVQYNKRDLSDDSTIEALHKKLDIQGAAVFEAIATEGTGVLQTLTTISKRVVRMFRESNEEAPAAPPPQAAPQPTPSPAPPMADAGATRIQLDPEPAQPAAAPPPAQPIADAGATRIQLDPEPAQPAAPSAAPPPVQPTAEAGATVIQLDPEPAQPAAPVTPAAQPPPTADADATMIQMDGPLTQPTPAPPAKEELDLLSSSERAAAPSLSIASVGIAIKSGETEIKIPVILRDEKGQDRRINLTIRLDPFDT